MCFAMHDLSNPATRLEFPEEVWVQYHRARLLQDASMAGMQRALRKLVRCKSSWTRFVPGFLSYNNRVYKKSAEAFRQTQEHLLEMERKIAVFNIFANETLTDTDNVATALRLLKNAYNCYSSAVSHAALGRGTKKVRKMKQEWVMCHQEVMNGFYNFRGALETDCSLRILKEMQLAVDVHDALGRIALELYAADLGQDSFPDFSQVRSELLSLLDTLDTTVSWQYLKHSRYKVM